MAALIFAVMFIVLIFTVVIGVIIYALIKSSHSKPKAPEFTYTQGRIMLVNDMGPDDPQVVIQYSVGKNTYLLTEKLQYNTKPIQSGDITIGHKKVPILKVEPDQNVVVMYKVKDPTLAVWVANNNPQHDVSNH